MSPPLRYVQIGVGGWGQHWCRQVLPRLKTLGLAVQHGCHILCEKPIADSMAACGRVFRQVTAAWMNPWLAEQFVRWLQGGEAPPNALADNIQCAALLFAAIESAHTRRPVNVQDFLQRHQA
ncbi:MAG: Gfo/Idh/MocA family oxidoreductase [Lentisphaerae bacterium]|nr:Gfo/Idh/MocA family oxidoreductase [Lentisphaerota bacterium]